MQYKTLKQLGRKALAVGGLVGILGLGCECNVKNENTNTTGTVQISYKTTQPTKHGYDFSEFGKFKIDAGRHELFRLGDMDGDGDLDIIIFEYN